MSKKIVLIVAVMAFMLSACSAAFAQDATQAPVETPVVTPSPDGPVSSDDETPAEDISYDPQPGDDQLIRQDVEIVSADILTLESFPPQFVLHLAGNKGNPCDYLRIVVSEPDEQNRVNVDVYRLVDPAGICIQMLESFDVNVSLGSLETGRYEVYVNGEMEGEIIAP
jgi:hypothetical protein